MNQPTATLSRRAFKGEPTWDIAYLFPLQGSWSEDDYFALDSNHLVEFDNGILEVLPMPTLIHQLIAGYCYSLLLAFAAQRNLGTVLFAPLSVRGRAGKYREPDVLFMKAENAHRLGKSFCEVPDLVMEVVSDSPEDRDRDLVQKRKEYAGAGIPEYCIIDPQKETISVLRLSGKAYAVHGTFGKGETAASHLLPGFAVDVSTTFSQRPVGKPEKKRRKQTPP